MTQTSVHPSTPIPHFQALDAQLEDAELRRMAVRAAAQQERERQWRVAKGLEDPGAWTLCCKVWVGKNNGVS